MLPRIDYLIFGYRRVRISGESLAQVSTSLISSKLSAKISPSGELYIFEPHYKKYMAVLARYDCEISEPLGLYGALYKRRKRYGAILGIVICLLIMMFSTGVVWDIRIEGENELSTICVEEALGAVGFSVGSRWSHVDTGELEREVLQNSDKIGWININRRGNVAYISVKSKTIYPPIPEEQYSNIVSLYDCVIEEITVKSGIAMVNAGDTVRRGQLLVSGVIPSELGGGLVHAEAEIKGRVNKKIKVDVNRCESYKSYQDELLSEMSLNIFGFSINIFKKYGNYSGEYDIIKSKEVWSVFGKYKLPVSTERSYVSRYVPAERSYSDSELVAIAASRLTEKRDDAVKTSEVVKITTDGQFTENGYTMYSDMILLTEIGENRSISD